MNSNFKVKDMIKLITSASTNARNEINRLEDKKTAGATLDEDINIDSMIEYNDTIIDMCNRIGDLLASKDLKDDVIIR